MARNLPIILIALIVHATATFGGAQVGARQTRAAAAGQRGNSEPTARQVGIAAIKPIVDELAQEAVAGWSRRGDWPRKQPDYASRSGHTLSNDQVMLALGSRLHEDPALEGYIKWQLLSYQPDLAQTDAKTLRRVLASLPPILPQPQPVDHPPRATSGNNRVTFALRGQHPVYIPSLSVTNKNRGLYRINPKASRVSAGGSVSSKSTGIAVDMRDRSELTHLVEQGAARLEQQRTIINTANVPALAYRDAIIRMLPPSGGLQLAARYQDMADRIHAGDKSYADASQAFVDACVGTAHDGSVGGGLRDRLIKQMRQLYRERVRVIQSITILEINKFEVREYDARLSEDHMKTADAALRGRPLRQ